MSNAEIESRLLEIRSKRNQQGQAHKKDAKKKKVSEKVRPNVSVFCT